MANRADEILDLAAGVGLRSDSFIFELVNEQRVHLGTLNVSEEFVPNVQVDTTRTVMRLANNVEILADDLSNVNVFKDRVRVWMKIQTADVYPCGVFMFGTQNTMPHTWGNRYTPALFDEAFLLNQGLPHTYTLKSGNSVLGLFRQLIGEMFLPDISIEVPDTITSSPLVYQVGTLRYDALKALAQVLGCFPPFFDNNGTFTLKPYPPIGSGQVDHRYGIGTRIFDDTTTIVSDAYTAPNRWIVVSGNAQIPVVGLYDLPASSPASGTYTGRIVTAPVLNVQGFGNATLANAAARNAALTDATVFDKATFDSATDPRHDIFDTVALLNTRYIETGWQIECSSGGPMHHSLSKIYD